MAIREVIFRGKSLDNGEWVHGDLQQWLDAVYISSDNKGWYSKTNYLVNAVTVGQFTGLTDKNGTKIFEGDIIKRKWNGGLSFYKIVFDDELGAFVGKTAKGGFTIFDYDAVCLEVIGNIHDNPEFLKGGAMDEKL